MLHGYLAQQVVNALILIGYYALVAVGLTVVFGTLDIINFAHGAFLMMGAFASAILVESGAPYIASVGFAIAVTFIFGMFIERTIAKPLRDKDPLTMLLATLGLFFAMQSGARLLFGTETKSIPVPWEDMGISIAGGYTLTVQRILLPIAAVIALTLFFLFINNTRYGRNIRAVSENRQAAELMGVNTDRYLLLVFALGVSMAGFAGAMIGPITSVSYTMGFWPTLVSFVIITIGGMGSYRGALVAAILVGLIETAGQVFLPTTWARLWIFVLLLVVLLFRPQGLFGHEEVGS